MNWLIERDEKGMPQRMVWCPEVEAAAKERERNKEEKAKAAGHANASNAGMGGTPTDYETREL